MDVVALVNRTPDPLGTWSSNWKPATLNDWVLLEGLSRSSSRVPAEPAVTFVLAGTTSTTREPARAVIGCPMAPSSTTAAAIAPRGVSRQGRTANLEEGRTRVRVRITTSMVVGCLRKKTLVTSLHLTIQRGASGCGDQWRQFRADANADSQVIVHVDHAIAHHVGPD